VTKIKCLIAMHKVSKNGIKKKINIKYFSCYIYIYMKTINTLVLYNTLPYALQGARRPTSERDSQNARLA
jgi:subtilase family serine protease